MKIDRSFCTISNLFQVCCLKKIGFDMELFIQRLHYYKSVQVLYLSLMGCCVYFTG